ncbi:MAG: hypothetical protein HKP48_09280 [Winogradskyella sp.]|uniref:hypothetical protein n=1 Tax=Winogradskyella sp. TaxID=1883156 RepID=UPI0017E0B1A6|nr:hypothetical protein [Winogradskyella sp.]MBT8244241.1 hypothetical protein [Winogradskyella sp.]NNK23462.1 hypothetical protein [Winogradskyella sp.]
MKKIILPVFVIVGSICIIAYNVITSEAFDKRFWNRSMSSIFLIIAMIIIIKTKKKQTLNDDN